MPRDRPPNRPVRGPRSLTLVGPFVPPWPRSRNREPAINDRYRGEFYPSSSFFSLAPSSSLFFFLFFLVPLRVFCFPTIPLTMEVGTHRGKMNNVTLIDLIRVFNTAIIGGRNNNSHWPRTWFERSYFVWDLLTTTSRGTSLKCTCLWNMWKRSGKWNVRMNNAAMNKVIMEKKNQ